MVNVINNHAEKKLPIAELFDNDNTCILEDGRIAFCAWMDTNLFDKVDEEDFLLCFIINNDGEANIEYIRNDTLATPCTVEIKVN